MFERDPGPRLLDDEEFVLTGSSSAPSSSAIAFSGTVDESIGAGSVSSCCDR